MHPLKTVLATAVVVGTTVGGAYAVGAASAGDHDGSTVTNPQGRVVDRHAAGGQSRAAGGRPEKTRTGQARSAATAPAAPGGRPTAVPPGQHTGNGHHYGQDPNHTDNGHHHGQDPNHTNHGHHHGQDPDHPNNGQGPPGR